MIITLAGHVDHGKTSLVGQLTGVDTDRLAEEKARGLTIDLGFAYTDLDGHKLGFVDVPGHHRFVHNMVAGVAAHQHALLVIAADDGVMPQTIEHLQILSLLGLRSGTIALNKVDRVTPDQIANARGGIKEAVAHTFLKDAPIIEVSAVTGLGIDTLKDHLVTTAQAFEQAVSHDGFRLGIDRAFSVRGSGVVVTGTVLAGSVALNDEVIVQPGDLPARVRGIHAQNETAETAVAGDRAAINLAGVDLDQVGRGQWLTDPKLSSTSTFATVNLEVVTDYPRAARHWSPVHVYHGPSHVQAHLALLDDTPITPGARGQVDVVLDEPLTLKLGDRLIIRDHDLGRTLGGGEIIDMQQPSGRRRTPARRARLQALNQDTPEAALSALAALGPVSLSEFTKDRNWSSTERVQALGDDSSFALVDGWLVDSALLDRTVKRAQTLLENHLKADPSSQGLAFDALLAQVQDHDDIGDVLLRIAITQLLKDGLWREESGRYTSGQHEVQLPADLQKRFETLQHTLDQKQPPSLGDIGKLLGVPLKKLDGDVKHLAAVGLLVRISPQRVFLPSQIEALAAQAKALDSDEGFTVRQFRDATGIGRNVVIEILEYFDLKRFTARHDNQRKVIGDSTKILAK